MSCESVASLVTDLLYVQHPVLVPAVPCVLSVSGVRWPQEGVEGTVPSIHLCVNMSSLKRSHSHVRVHSSSSLWEVWTLPVNILLTAMAWPWLQGKGAFCFCVTVSDPSLSLGQRGRQRGEGGTAGASRLLLGTFKYWHIRRWKVCDRQFSCDLDPESLRKFETIF